MTLNEILVGCGKSVKDIEKIYHGKDNYCRCGCGGRYFYEGDRGFTRAINTMNRELFHPIEVDDESNNYVPYVNIAEPSDDPDGRCYTIYFK